MGRTFLDFGVQKNDILSFIGGISASFGDAGPLRRGSGPVRRIGRSFLAVCSKRRHMRICGLAERFSNPFRKVACSQIGAVAAHQESFYIRASSLFVRKPGAHAFADR